MLLTGYEDLGFVRLFSHNGSTSQAVFHEAIKKICPGYFEFVTTGGCSWARARARVEGHNRPNLIHKLFQINKNDLTKEDPLHAIKRWAHSKYCSEWCSNVVCPLKESRAVFYEIENGADDEPTHWRWISSMLATTHPSDLKELLEDFIAPYFFSRYPQGEIWGVMPDFDIISLSRIPYIAHALATFPRDILPQGAEFNRIFEGAAKWQPNDLVIEFSTILRLASALFYPELPFLCLSSFGLHLIFIFDSPNYLTPYKTETQWIDFLRPTMQFGEQDYTLSQNLETIKQNKDRLPQAHRRYLNKTNIPIQELQLFLDWIITKYNDQAFERCALDGFPLDPSQNTDFTFMWAHNLSLSRIGERALSCIHSHETFERKLALFETIDIISDLKCRWVKDTPAQTFQSMFDISYTLPRVEMAFSSAPEQIQAEVLSMLIECFDELDITVRESIIVPGRADDLLGIRLSGEPNGQPIAWSDFTGGLMRSLRNSAHGYKLTETNMKYLVLSTCNIPDSITHLGAILGLAAILSPQTITGWQWPDISAFPKLPS